MKTLIAVLLFTVTLTAQVYQIPPKNNEPKENYRYIVVYREWEQYHKMRGDSFFSDYGWLTKVEGSRDWEGLTGWLNSSDWGMFGKEEKKVRFTEEELIMVYDLEQGRKIELQLKVEDVVKPKRVEVQEERWTNKSWEKKK